MKKTLLSLAILATIGAFAQTTVTFDDLTLAPNSYWSGSDGSGQFISNGVTFPNQYNMDWSYWSGGFVYSNSTNVDSAGYTNDFSAFTGIGANGSANYGVNYGGDIDFGSEKVVSSIAITNTTYAALSMLFGDTYGKVFGSPNDANGTPDGTNGADYFRLLITGYNANNDSVGQVTFYLADYRFADSTQDYLVNTWETVDLTALGAIRYLKFDLESSDTGGAGMNTPGYFALDNLVYGILGMEENQALAFTISPNPTTENVTIKGVAGNLTVVDAAGTLVYEAKTNGLSTISCENWSTGYYIISCSNEFGVYHSTIIKN